MDPVAARFVRFDLELEPSSADGHEVLEVVVLLTEAMARQTAQLFRPEVERFVRLVDQAQSAIEPNPWVSQNAGVTSSGRDNPFASPVVKQPEPFKRLSRSRLGEAQVSTSDLKIAHSTREQPERQAHLDRRMIAGSQRRIAGGEHQKRRQHSNEDPPQPYDDGL
jgi:hypothetical protein